jgi:hypothetical protein
VRVGQHSGVDEWRGGHGHDRFSPEEATVNATRVAPEVPAWHPEPAHVRSGGTMPR